MTGPAEEHRHPAAKRQRTNNQRDMTNEENFQGGDRRGQSAVGGELRLDVSSCLTQAEADILSVITEAVKLSKLQTVVRVAGGWVRDKLLGLEVRVIWLESCVFSNKLFEPVEFGTTPYTDPSFIWTASASCILALVVPQSSSESTAGLHRGAGLTSKGYVTSCLPVLMELTFGRKLPRGRTATGTSIHYY